MDPGCYSRENPAALGPGWRLAGAVVGRAGGGGREGRGGVCGKGGVLRRAGGVIYAEQALLPLPLTLPARCLELEEAQGAS